MKIWQDKANKQSFRIQTNDRELHRRMQKDDRFQLAGEGLNIDVWVYQAEFPSRQAASIELKGMKKATEQDSQ
jgi:hypothetical protein